MKTEKVKESAAEVVNTIISQWGNAAGPSFDDMCEMIINFHLKFIEPSSPLYGEESIQFSPKGGELHDNKLSELALIKLVKSFSECTYNSETERYKTQWAFTEEQILSVVQNIISICHIHQQ